MGEGTHRINVPVRTSGAEELRKVREELARAGVASDYLNTFLGQTSIELTKARAKTRTYSEETKALAQQYGLSVEGLDKLNRRIRDSDAVYEEATQKLEDARKKLDEYGATAEQQAAAIGLIFKSAERTNNPLAKQALIMEELAIELQDADAATRLYDQALALVEKRGGRVEDRVAELTEAYKGQTSALGNLGPVAKSAVSGLDELRSQELKAVEVKKRFDRESTRQLTTLDKVNDRITLSKVRWAEFVATLGPVGQVAGVVAGALVGLGLGGLKVATDATNAYIQSNREARNRMEILRTSIALTEQDIGELIYRSLDLDKTLIGLAGTTGLISDNLDSLGSVIRSGLVTPLGDALLKAEGFDDEFDSLLVKVAEAAIPFGFLKGAVDEYGESLEPVIRDTERLAKAYGDAANNAKLFADRVKNFQEEQNDRARGLRERRLSVLNANDELEESVDPSSVIPAQGPLRPDGSFDDPAESRDAQRELRELQQFNQETEQRVQAAASERRNLLDRVLADARKETAKAFEDSSKALLDESVKYMLDQVGIIGSVLTLPSDVFARAGVLDEPIPLKANLKELAYEISDALKEGQEFIRSELARSSDGALRQEILASLGLVNDGQVEQELLASLGLTGSPVRSVSAGPPGVLAQLDALRDIEAVRDRLRSGEQVSDILGLDEQALESLDLAREDLEYISRLVLNNEAKTADRRSLMKRAGVDAEDLLELDLDLSTRTGLDEFEEMIEASEQLNAGLNRLATEGLANLTFGLIDLTAALAAGGLSTKEFGQAFLGNLGGVLERAGEGMFLLGLGTLNIATGLTNPAALIAVGAGLKIAGAAMSAYGSRSSSGRTSGGSGGATSATREAFRESTDRLLAEQDRERQAIYVLADFGGAIVDVPVQRINRRLDRQGLAV